MINHNTVTKKVTMKISGSVTISKFLVINKKICVLTEWIILILGYTQTILRPYSDHTRTMIDP